MTIEEFGIRESRRADCYRILAACFYPPYKDNLLKGEPLVGLKDALAVIEPSAGTVAAALADEVASTKEVDLSIDFARLFVGPFKLIAPPYGSVYLEKGEKMMGDSTIDILDVYRKAGLVIDKDFKDLPDHIAAELEFMHYLIYKEVESIQKGEYEEVLKWITMQEEFLKIFLVPWIPEFSNKIIKDAETPFYKALGELLKMFVPGDRVSENLPKELAVEAV